MRKILRIAQTEFQNSLRSKAFIISALAVPIIYAVVFVGMHVANQQKDTSDKSFVVVDKTGKLYPAISAAAERRGDLAPRFLPSPEEPGADQEAFLLALSERVRDGDIFAFAIIDQDVLEAGAIAATVDYYSETPTYKKLPNWLEKTISHEVRRIRLEAKGYDIEEVELLTKAPHFRGMELVEISDQGEVELGKEDNMVRHYVVPFVMVMMMFVMVMTAAPALLTTSLEEKSNKVFEFLVSAVTPFQLMMGKLLGAIATALALSVIYVGAATIFAAHKEVLGQIPLSLYPMFYFFLALSVMIYGAVCVAIGSVCSDIRDAQGLMLPVTLLLIVPMIVLQPVLDAPAGTFAKAVTYFPPATPVMLLLRSSVPPGLVWWEFALGVLVSVAFMIFAVWAAAKVFRIGVLSQGQTPTLAKLARWIFSK